MTRLLSFSDLEIVKKNGCYDCFASVLGLKDRYAFSKFFNKKEILKKANEMFRRNQGSYFHLYINDTDLGFFGYKVKDNVFRLVKIFSFSMF